MSFITEMPEASRQPRVRRSAQITEEIKHMIFNGDLKPGDRIPTEEKLCNHFDVSRTTLRESIQMLRVSGLLEVTPGRGSFITKPDIASLLKDITLFAKCTPSAVEDVQFIRQTLQVEIAKKSCKTPLNKRTNLQMYQVHKDNTPEENERMERLWHLAIAETTGNCITKSLLEAVLMILQEQNIQKYRDPDEVIRTSSIQIRLNAAIANGDVETAGRVMEMFLTVQQKQRLAS